MVFNYIKDFILPDSQPSGTAAQTKTFRIKREPRRVDALHLRLRLDQGAVAPTGAAWGGLAGAVKEIRVRVADGQTTRNAVQITGPALLSFLQFSTLEGLDSYTLDGYASSGFPVSVTQNLTFTIPFSDVRLQEPFRHVTGLPLWLLAEDVIVEVDLNDIVGGGTVFTANPPTYAAVGPALSLGITYREGTEALPYIPSELRTDTGFAPQSTSSPSYEFSSIGFLTSALIQTFSATAMGNAVTRATLLANGSSIFRLEYGRKVVERTDESFKVASQEGNRFSFPRSALSVHTTAGATLQARNWPNEYFWDWLNDSPGTPVFSARSVINVSQQALLGDKFRIFFNDLAATTRGIHITTHKWLPAKDADLDILSSRV
jgi:hypothetical protein